MFRYGDIVKLQAGREGIARAVRQSKHKGKTVTVQMGADGPLVHAAYSALRFGTSKHLEECGGINFFKREFIVPKRRTK